MKYTEGNDIQEKPILAIENDDNSTSSQELLDEPTIIIESSGEMKHNSSSDSIKKRGGLPKWSLAIMWFVATVVLVFGCYGAIRLYNYYYNIGVSIIETPHPETLWDFADALREYGYVDAVYLTGGNESGFYRALDGTAYFTERAAKYRTDKHHGVAPWLVLRKR